MTDPAAREREIVLLQRMIQSDQSPGCLKGIVGYLGMVILFGVIAIVITIGTEMKSAAPGVLVYGAGLVSYVIYWQVGRSKLNKKKARLNQLLKEEQQDMKRG